MMYDDRHVFINGESFRVAGSDARCLRQLANDRQLPAAHVLKMSDASREALEDWMSAGWLKTL